MDFEVNLHICRICLKNQQVSDLFNNEELKHKFEFTFKLELKTDDNMPTHICARCVARLGIAYNLVRLAVNSDKKLRSFLAKTYNEFQVVTQINTDFDSEDNLLEIIDMDEEACVSSQEFSLDEPDLNESIQQSEMSLVSPNENDLEAVADTTVIDLIDTIDQQFDEAVDEIEPFAVEDSETLQSDTVFTVEPLTIVDDDREIKQNSQLEVSYQIEKTRNSDETTILTIPNANRPWCKICKRDFSTRTNLTRHMKTHEGKKPHRCQFCGKEFSQKSTLTQHIYTHTGEKPFICQTCNRGFSQYKTLISHMRLHTGVKPFPCEFCGSFFRQREGLRAHILKYHAVQSNERPDTSSLSCSICKQDLADVTAFKSHIKKHLNNHASTELKSTSTFVPLEHLTVMEEGASKSTGTGINAFAHIVDETRTYTQDIGRYRKYQCRLCFKRFAKKTNFIEHLTVHDIHVK